MTRTDLRTPPVASPHRHDHGLTQVDKALAAKAPLVHAHPDINARLAALEEAHAVTKALLLASIGGGSFHPPAPEEPEPPAEPDYAAEGFGKNALWSGARTDYHVTDGGNGTGAGTLRAALSASNRNIIFDVDTITLSATEGAELQLDAKSNIVIDGSTHANGVTILNQSLRFDDCDHIVIRDIAFRDCVARWEGAIQLRRSHDLLIDRCSFSEWLWRGIDITDASHDVTVQWCFFGPYSNDHVLYAGAEPHYPAYVGDLSYHASFDHNLFYNHEYRQPLATYDMDPVLGLTDPNTTMDVANQLVYNTLAAFPTDPGYYSAVGAKNGSKVNVRQTYFHSVANTGSNHAIFSEQEGGADEPGIYVSGCKFKGDAGSLGTDFPVGSAYSTSGYVLPLESTATIAAEAVLAHAGRYPRDAADTAWAAAIEVT